MMIESQLGGLKQVLGCQEISQQFNQENLEYNQPEQNIKHQKDNNDDIPF